MKKLICIVISLCLLVSVLVVPSFAAEGENTGISLEVKHGTEVYVKGKVDNTDGKYTGKMLDIKLMANEYSEKIVPEATYDTISYKIDETGEFEFKFRYDALTYDKIGQCNRRIYATIDDVDVTSSIESITARDLYYVEAPFENTDDFKSEITTKFKEFFDEYSYGRTVYLKKADENRIKISLETLGFSSSLSVKIKEMNDEKIKYIRLYAVGENTPVPVVKERKIAIWKLDDLQMSDSKIDGFQNAYNYFSQYGIRAGFGVIVHSFDEYGDLTTGKNKEKIDKINSWIDGGFEIWYHGYWHNKNTGENGERVEDFATDSLEKQEKNLKLGVDAFKKAFPDYTLKSFGAPYNAGRATTVQALKNACPDINSVLYFGSDSTEGTDMFNINNSLAIESTAGDEDFGKFEQSFKSMESKDYIIIQSHPGGWDAKDLEVIDKITKVLVSKDYAFMTPQEYYNYCKNK